MLETVECVKSCVTNWYVKTVNWFKVEATRKPCLIAHPAHSVRSVHSSVSNLKAQKLKIGLAIKNLFGFFEKIPRRRLSEEQLAAAKAKNEETTSHNKCFKGTQIVRFFKNLSRNTTYLKSWKYLKTVIQRTNLGESSRVSIFCFHR